MSTSVYSSNNSIPNNTFQPFQIEKPNAIGRLVEWIRGPKDRPLFTKVAIYALSFFLTTLMIFSLVGIPLVLKGFQELGRQQEQAKMLPAIEDLETRLLQTTSQIERLNQRVFSVESNAESQIREILVQIEALKAQKQKIELELQAAQSNLSNTQTRELRYKSISVRQTVLIKELARQGLELFAKLDKLEVKLADQAERYTKFVREQETEYQKDLDASQQECEKLKEKYQKVKEKLVAKIQMQNEIIERQQKQLEAVQLLFKGIQTFTNQNPALVINAKRLSSGENVPLTVKLTPDLQRILSGVVVMSSLASPQWALPSNETNDSKTATEKSEPTVIIEEELEEKAAS